MPGSTGQRSTIGLRAWLLPIGVLVLSTGVLWRANATAGGPLATDKAVRQATSEDPLHNESLADYKRLVQQAEQLEASGRTADAVVVLQKAITTVRASEGDASESIAQVHERMARLHETREEWTAAQHARSEVLAIRIKQHGDKDWRVTDARLALRNRGNSLAVERCRATRANSCKRSKTFLRRLFCMKKETIAKHSGSPSNRLMSAVVSSATRTRTLPIASTPWACCLNARVISRKRSRSLARQSTFTEKPWARNTHARWEALTTWVCSTSHWANTPKRNRS